MKAFNTIDGRNQYMYMSLLSREYRQYVNMKFFPSLNEFLLFRSFFLRSHPSSSFGVLMKSGLPKKWCRRTMFVPCTLMIARRHICTPTEFFLHRAIHKKIFAIEFVLQLKIYNEAPTNMGLKLDLPWFRYGQWKYMFAWFQDMKHGFSKFYWISRWSSSRNETA